ncbi:MAG: DUF2341 domain-containing protein [Kiritimatiellae bacterium]|nr:DUF2341 domain-containing protein [Kiritimatiellia bacterium]
MKRPLHCLAAAAVLCALAPAARAEALDTTPFTCKIPVTVSGYAGSTELADFPVLVALAADSPTGFDYADCASDGSDLRFADATGALLSHEIETWDTNGTSYVWVKVPSLVGTATTFSGYYGTNGTAALPAVAATDVWSRYAAVFHGGATIADATGHAASIAPNGVTAAAIGGMAGGVMTKGVATGVTFSNPVTSGALSSIGSFSFSGWFRKSGGTTSVVFSNKGNGEWNGNGFVALVESGNYFSVGVGVNGSGGHQPTSNNNKGKLAVGTWGHLAFSYDKSATSLDSYFNGDTIYSTSSARNILDPGKSVWAFGGFFDGNKNCFQGDMDEVRVLNGSATADWIKAEYDSVAAPAAFAVPGGVVAVDHSAPVLGTPSLARNANGTFTVSVEVSGNAPASIVCSAGGTDFAMTTADEELPATYAALVSGLAAGTCTATVRAAAASGAEVSAACPTAFHVGALVATVVADADEGTLAPGTFRIARADADATGLPALSFDVAFSGEGLDAIVAPTVSTLAIPAGEAYVDLAITPAFAPAVDADADLVLTVSGDLVGASSTATMTVVNASFDPTVRYVATTGDDANHGGTPEMPKLTIAAAVASLEDVAQSTPCTIHVAPGLYSISAPIVLTNAVSVLGTAADPSRTVVSNRVSAGWNAKDQRVFRIDHAGAVVANLTMQAGQDYGDGGDFNIGSAGGMVSNCVVEAGYTRDNGRAGGAWLDGGTVSHTVFRRNRSNSASGNWADNRPGVLQLNGSAKAENCLFAENDQSVAVTLINLSGSSVMRNCTIVDSGLSVTNAYCKAWSALNIGSGATAQNVVVAGVTNTVDGAAVLPTGSVAKFANGAVDGDISELAFPEGTVIGTAAAFFKNPAAGDWRPRSDGPLANAGANYAPMALYDLTGEQKRLIGPRVDIGCYEANAAGTVLVVK